MTFSFFWKSPSQKKKKKKKKKIIQRMINLPFRSLFQATRAPENRIAFDLSGPLATIMKFHVHTMAYTSLKPGISG